MVDNDDMSVIFPGRIVAYYPEKQTADVVICAERVFTDTDDSLLQVPRTKLVDVPVHTPYGGGWSLTFPIKPGDTCMLCFSQIGYDHWFYNDQDTGGTVVDNPAPHLRRQFSEDDGFVMVGFNTKPRAIDKYHETSSQWRNEDTEQVITLNEDLSIEIKSPNLVTVNCEELVANATISADVNTVDATVVATGSIDFTTPIFNVNAGRTIFSGDVDVVGTLTAGGVEVNDHDHVGDSGGTTGPMK